MTLNVAIANIEVLRYLEPHQRTGVIIDPETQAQSIELDERWFQGVRRSLSAGCSREDLRQAIHWTMDTIFKHDIDTTMIATILKHLQTVLSVTYPDFTSMHDSLNELLEETFVVAKAQRQLAMEPSSSSSSSSSVDDEDVQDSLETPVLQPQPPTNPSSQAKLDTVSLEESATTPEPKDQRQGQANLVSLEESVAIPKAKNDARAQAKPKKATTTRKRKRRKRKRRKRKRKKVHPSTRHKRRGAKPKKQKKLSKQATAIKQATDATKCRSFCGHGTCTLL